MHDGEVHTKLSFVDDDKGAIVRRLHVVMLGKHARSVVARLCAAADVIRSRPKSSLDEDNDATLAAGKSQPSTRSILSDKVDDLDCVMFDAEETRRIDNADCPEGDKIMDVRLSTARVVRLEFFPVEGPDALALEHNVQSMQDTIFIFLAMEEKCPVSAWDRRLQQLEKHMSENALNETVNALVLRQQDSGRSSQDDH
eukprot:TRINITY_DN51563_c0_g1_i1.p1 TRINITY_DN51563_c0_g1~~TRINITY_DN51563_c0_g1_i1.p1  ORF type:complete len:213 (-),score=19.26 TRINITY_DN51563_c0_g1_i1:99-692(-)